MTEKSAIHGTKWNAEATMPVRCPATHFFWLTADLFLICTIHKIGFHPLITENYSFFWSVDSGFGTISKKNGKFLLKVLYGYLDLKELELDLSEIKEIKLNKKLLEFTISNGIIVLNKVIRVDANHTLRIKETFIE